MPSRRGGRLILAANDFAASPYYSSVTVPASQLEWDSRKARWGLKLGVEPAYRSGCPVEGRRAGRVLEGNASFAHRRFGEPRA